MSGLQPQRPGQSAGEYVRSILDDRPEEQVSPSGELYRVIERFHETVDRARRTISDISFAAVSSIPTIPSDNSGARNLQRRFSREPAGRDTPATSLSSPLLPPLRHQFSRRSSNMPGGSASRSRFRPSAGDRHRPPAANATPAALGAAVDSSLSELELRLDNANSQLRTLLELNTNAVYPPPSPPLISPPVHAQDSVDDGRRAKRRKLDASTPISSSRGFRYGRYGQVEPGQLNMEIVSCEGDTYFDSIAAFAADNILRSDSSFYCAKGNRCNLILRHQGATVFSLKELMIKAPTISHTCSAREGMVFVSMDKDELLTRTAQYQIQYGRAKESGRAGSSSRDGRTQAPVYSVRHGEDGTFATRISGRRRVLSIMGDHEDRRLAQIPSEFTVAPPPFRVTAEYSDDDDDHAHIHLRHRRQTPNRIGSLPFESDSGDDWAQIDDTTQEEDMTYTGRRESMTLQEAIDADQLATQEAVRAVGGTMMTPHARFIIERDKCKCTIRFDPPISGRFVLIKLWSSVAESESINIQGVVAKGFAGPRYIPSTELM